ncbi:MAG: N-acetylmuramic acid 6-phosphate etherase [Deltaproteobacteria bacterium]|jgi:N-acetylmuramic acid 6-phosphate etherase|nr:N-acetylmuramic acid 6-phosphate etherase [Deltaproteobacteria bacterium]
MSKEIQPALITESENPASQNIDLMPTLEIVSIINNEDKKVALAVEKVLPEIAQAVDGITERLKHGGRLIYFGAGTSGRLGVLDASECPPTFNVPKGKDALVIGCIAGGEAALINSIEDSEDRATEAEDKIKELNISSKDAVVGISANGSPIYVLTAIRKTRELGALTIGISCNPSSPLITESEIGISVIVGSEVITGSSRMKAGTAQKMILNILTTSTMIKLGKTYGNLMVDLQPLNKKLIVRQRRIVAKVGNVSEEVAEQKLVECNRETKTAIVSLLYNLSPSAARKKLAEHGGVIRKIIQ